jgi:hypothetical protein
MNTPPERESPDSLVISFSDCTVADGMTMDEVFAGLDNWTAYQTETGYMNGTWVFFPAYGGGDEDFDFKMVNAWDSHAERGRDYDLYANAGGYQKRREIMGSMLDCNVSRFSIQKSRIAAALVYKESRIAAAFREIAYLKRRVNDAVVGAP